VPDFIPATVLLPSSTSSRLLTAALSPIGNHFRIVDRELDGCVSELPRNVNRAVTSLKQQGCEGVFQGMVCLLQCRTAIEASLSSLS
jgi:hypothetical protein